MFENTDIWEEIFNLWENNPKARKEGFTPGTLRFASVNNGLYGSLYFWRNNNIHRIRLIHSAGPAVEIRANSVTAYIRPQPMPERNEVRALRRDITDIVKDKQDNDMVTAINEKLRKLSESPNSNIV
jgi:hypothetical protein